MSRVWAMSSMHTFTIPPIRELIGRYVGDGKGWIDPFAGENSPAEYTNDLNPDKPAKYHLHALEFAKILIPNRGGVQRMFVRPSLLYSTSKRVLQ